jgi:hypothetical protein
MKTVRKAPRFERNKVGAYIITQQDLNAVTPLEKLFILIQSLLPADAMSPERVLIADNLVWARLFLEVHALLRKAGDFTAKDVEGVSSFILEEGHLLGTLLIAYRHAVDTGKAKSISEISENFGLESPWRICSARPFIEPQFRNEIRAASEGNGGLR